MIDAYVICYHCDIFQGVWKIVPCCIFETPVVLAKYVGLTTLYYLLMHIRALLTFFCFLFFGRCLNSATQYNPDIVLYSLYIYSVVKTDCGKFLSKPNCSLLKMSWTRTTRAKCCSLLCYVIFCSVFCSLMLKGTASM